MNHIFRLIWNRSSATFIAVSEHAASGGGKSAGAATAGGLSIKTVALMLALHSSAQALPAGPVVVAGAASVNSRGTALSITQSSPNVALNWQNFNIGAGESVTFMQPGSSAVALNRVLGADPSSILGKLSANGKVFLVNPNGILFGPGAQVNVGALVASTLAISDADFMARNYQFSQAGSGAVFNQGVITAASGGYIALLGAKVSNDGVIAAQLGTVALAGGNAVTLDLAGDGLLNLTVRQGMFKALVRNGGLLQADGGQVLLTTAAAGSLLQNAVNNTGVIEARSLSRHDGRISLLAGMQAGSVEVGGTLDASAPRGGNGGMIDTSAAQVKLGSDVHVTTLAAQGATGTWLIDPHDYTVAASGADLTGAQLSLILAGTNVELKSSAGALAGAGNINLNDAVTWSANTRLTLTAANNINLNANLTASGASAALILNPNTANTLLVTEAASGAGNVNFGAGVSVTLSGAAASLSMSGAPYTLIHNAAALQAMNSNLTANYALGNNIDAAAIASFLPVGTAGTGAFMGAFNGLGHTISNLTIHGGAASNIGLFGTAGSASQPTTLSNVGLLNASVDGASYVGALAGFLNGSVSNSSVTGSVTASGSYGGALVGSATGSISNSSSSASVAGVGSAIGALAGAATGTVSSSAGTGAVTKLIALTVTANDVTQTYDGSAFQIGSVSYSVAPNLSWLALLSNTGSANGAVNAGAYVITPHYAGQSHYLITYVSGALVIVPRALTALGLKADSKTYDGTTVANVTVSTLSGLLASDRGTLALTGTFATKDAHKAIVVTPGLSGTAAVNYTLNQSLVTLSADINAKSVSLTGASAMAKTYDGTTLVNVRGGSLSGVLEADSAAITLNAAFANKNAGKAVPVSASLSGSAALNYSLIQPTLAADIKARILSLSEVSVSTKTYDGARVTSVTGGTLSGLLPGDSKSVKLSVAGAGKDVSATTPVSIGLSGADAGNYMLSQPLALIADLVPVTIQTMPLVMPHNGDRVDSRLPLLALDDVAQTGANRSPDQVLAPMGGLNLTLIAD